MTIFGNAIYTPRLCLRKITEEDIPILVEWSSSDAANGQYLTPEHLTETSCRNKLENNCYWSGHDKTFFIETKDEKKPLGIIHYWIRAERNSCAVVMVKISDPATRGAGYGTEAQKYLIIHLFERLKLYEVEMYTDINNKPQQRCLSKLGFDLIESLTYDDHQVTRLGHLYRIDSIQYQQCPIYQYHYE